MPVEMKLAYVSPPTERERLIHSIASLAVCKRMRRVVVSQFEV
jgi:hypothetical protein